MNIEKRPDYREARNPKDNLQRDLRELAERHGLTGVVLIQFDTERVGCRSWGVAPAMMRQWTRSEHVSWLISARGAMILLR